MSGEERSGSRFNADQRSANLEPLCKSGMMDANGDKELVQEVLIEGFENVDNLERELVTLESNPGDMRPSP